MALTVDFAPDGHRLVRNTVWFVCGVEADVRVRVQVTGSDDNSIRVWDLRLQKAVYTIAAHNECVTHVKVCVCECVSVYVCVCSRVGWLTRAIVLCWWRNVVVHIVRLLCEGVGHARLLLPGDAGGPW